MAWNPRRTRIVLPAVAALAAVAAVWHGTASSPPGVAAGASRSALDGEPARPVPAMDGWQPAGGGLLDGRASLALYLTDDPPEVAAVRAAGRFRAAGWAPLSLRPGGIDGRAPPAFGASPDEGRRLLAFRSGGAVCWILAEADPRSGRTRCVVAGP
jgi:hypothetical protein